MKYANVFRTVTLSLFLLVVSSVAPIFGVDLKTTLPPFAEKLLVVPKQGALPPLAIVLSSNTLSVVDLDSFYNQREAKTSVFTHQFPEGAGSAANMVVGEDQKVYVILNFMGNAAGKDSPEEAIYNDDKAPIIVRYALRDLVRDSADLVFDKESVLVRQDQLQTHSGWGLEIIGERLFFTLCSITTGGRSKNACYGKPVLAAINLTTGQLVESTTTPLPHKNPMILQALAKTPDYLAIVASEQPSDDRGYLNLGNREFVFAGYAGPLAYDNEAKRIFICNSNPYSTIPVIDLNNADVKAAVRNLKFDSQSRSCNDLAWRANGARANLYLAHSTLSEGKGAVMVSNVKDGKFADPVELTLTDNQIITGIELFKNDLLVVGFFGDKSWLQRIELDEKGLPKGAASKALK